MSLCFFLDSINLIFLFLLNLLGSGLLKVDFLAFEISFAVRFFQVLLVIINFRGELGNLVLSLLFLVLKCSRERLDLFTELRVDHHELVDLGPVGSLGLVRALEEVFA